MRAAGFDLVLTKPIDLGSLVAAVRSVDERRRAAQPVRSFMRRLQERWRAGLDATNHCVASLDAAR